MPSDASDGGRDCRIQPANTEYAAWMQDTTHVTNATMDERVRIVASTSSTPTSRIDV